MCISMYEIDVSSPDKLKKTNPRVCLVLKKKESLELKKNPFKL